MSDNTTSGENTPEDNELIRDLREQLKTAKRATKTAGDDAIALVERGTKAAGLMPEGFKGLADIYATEVDGELTADSAAEWLKGRGFAASSDKLEEEEAEVASDLEKVTDLGGAVAAAGNLTPEGTLDKQLGEVIDPTVFQSLEDVTKAMEKVLEGQ